MPFNCVNYGWVGKGLGAAMLGLLLGGCDGTLTADLSTDPPADTSIRNVQVNLLGLDFRKSDGTFNDAGVQFGRTRRPGGSPGSGIPCDCSRTKSLPAGSYTGVRLLFDEDVSENVVTDRDGDIPLVLADGAYAAVDFSVEDEQSSTEKLSLMLDLRQSLSYEKAKNRYTLTPALRSVSTDDAARIEGVVTVVCPLDPLLVPGEAVYLFAGTDVSPDDLDGAGVGAVRHHQCGEVGALPRSCTHCGSCRPATTRSR